MSGSSQGKRALDKVQMAIGRVFKHVIKKEPDVYESFKAMCLAHGASLTDEMTKLMIWDLQGQINNAPQTPQQSNPGQPPTDDPETDPVLMMGRMAGQYTNQIQILTDQFRRRETQLLNEVAELQFQLRGMNVNESSREADTREVDSEPKS